MNSQIMVSRRAAVALSLIVLMGCATPPATRVLPRSLGAHLPTYRPSAENLSAARLLEPPTGEMTLDRALRLALEYNPALEAVGWETRSHDGLVAQAALLPNPELFADVENIGGSGAFEDTMSAETTFGVSVPVEVGGKRTKRTQLAQSERTLADWDFEAARLDVYTEVTAAFAGVKIAEGQLEVARERVGVASEALRVVTAAPEEGAVSELARVRAEVTLARTRAQSSRRQAQLENARLRLSATWGGLGAQFSATGDDIESLSPPPELAPLLAMAAQNPDAARWEDELERLKRAVDVERAEAMPDLYLTAGVRHFSSDDESAAVFGLSVPLPLFDRNQGNVAAAGAQLAKGRAEQRMALTGVRQEMARARERVELAYDVARQLREDLLPEAEAALQKARSSSRARRVPHLLLLDAHGTVLDLRDEYLDALFTYHEAAANLNRLAGRYVLGPAPAAASTASQRAPAR